MSNISIDQEYELLSNLGEGGFAVVYKAKHKEWEYIRAIRILNCFITDEKDKKYTSFVRECKTLLRLGNGSHPNIVHIYQPRLVGHQALVEMDYVDGIDLKRFIAQNGGMVPVEEIIRMAEQISSALAYCHHDIYRVCMNRDDDRDLISVDPDDGKKVVVLDEEKLIEKYRVIHNDIHCGNIMRRNDDMYILLDFGLAVDGQGDVVGSSRLRNGAPEYKAPERWDDNQPSAQSDIYSFGCVLYAMITGNPPFPCPSKGSPEKIHAKVMAQHKEEKPREIERQDVPEWLKEIVMHCLEKKPEDRYEDGKALYAAVKAGVEKMQMSNVEAEKKIAELNTAIQQIGEENSTLKSSMEKMEEEKGRLESKIEQVGKEKSSLTVSIGELGQEISSLNESIKGKDAEIERLKKTNPKPKWFPFVLLGLLLGGGIVYAISPSVESGHQEEMEILRAERDSLKVANDNISLQLENMGKNNGASAAYQNRLRAAQKSKDSLENVVVSLRNSQSNNKDNSKLQGEINRLKNSIAEKDRSIAAKDKTITQKNNTITQKNKEIERLNKRIDLLMGQM